jgi:hypothetical protein
VAASLGIISGMLLGLPSSLAMPLMVGTMLLGFAVAPLVFKGDQRINPGQNGAEMARQIDRELYTRVNGAVAGWMGRR